MKNKISKLYQSYKSIKSISKRRTILLDKLISDLRSVVKIIRSGEEIDIERLIFEIAADVHKIKIIKPSKEK